MRLTRRELALLLGTTAVAAGRPLRGQKPGAAPIQPPPDAFFARLPTLMEVAGVPGVAAGVISGGRLAWTRYIGVAEAGTSRAITADSLFPAASLGKPVFAYAALLLADEGRLDLDRPLKSYSPPHAPADPRGDRITARHVLSHSSGFRNWRGSADQLLVPDFDPGARFQYSGEGYYYLQCAIEQITGRGFEAWIQQQLLEPLKMTSSTYAWRSDTAERLVFGHTRGTVARQNSRDFATRLFQQTSGSGKPLASLSHEDLVAVMKEMRPAPPPLPNFMLPNAAGSLLTTVSDYAAFLVRLLDGAGAAALKPSTRQQMLSPQVKINSVLSWGYGWGIEQDAAGEYFWHWGDNGVYRNFVLAHLPSRSAVVVFTNGSLGMRVAEAFVTAAAGRKPFGFDWL